MLWQLAWSRYTISFSHTSIIKLRLSFQEQEVIMHYLHRGEDKKVQKMQFSLHIHIKILGIYMLISWSNIKYQSWYLILDQFSCAVKHFYVHASLITCQHFQLHKFYSSLLPKVFLLEAFHGNIIHQKKTRKQKWLEKYFWQQTMPAIPKHPNNFPNCKGCCWTLCPRLTWDI